ncbi:hypothetical protein [Pedobacter jamesrossensis]
MHVKFHYETLSSGIEELKKRGFILDFNLQENSFFSPESKFRVGDFKIVDIYRYEGDTDPADEVCLYALESVAGNRGFLLASYGASTDEYSTKLLALLKEIS